MKPVPESLVELQRWMLAAITHPLGIEAGVLAVESATTDAIAERGLAAVIPATTSQSSVDRLAVYGNAYYSRLLQVLRELFPAVRHAVGDESFDEFVLAYLQEYPPTSYTLADLARHFVTFLDETRQATFGGDTPLPDDAVDDSQVDDNLRFVVELARFEFTIDEVFDGPGIEGQDLPIRQQIAELAPAAWAQAMLVPVPSLRLLSSDFPVNEFYSAFRRGESPEIPARAPSHLAIVRRNFVVRRYPLSSQQFALLSALARGQSIAAAIAEVTEHDPAADFGPLLAQWFTFWSAEEFFERLSFS